MCFKIGFSDAGQLLEDCGRVWTIFGGIVTRFLNDPFDRFRNTARDWNRLFVEQFVVNAVYVSTGDMTPRPFIAEDLDQHAPERPDINFYPDIR